MVTDGVDPARPRWRRKLHDHHDLGAAPWSRPMPGCEPPPALRASPQRRHPNNTAAQAKDVFSAARRRTRWVPSPTTTTGSISVQRAGPRVEVDNGKSETRSVIALRVPGGRHDPDRGNDDIAGGRAGRCSRVCYIASATEDNLPTSRRDRGTPGVLRASGGHHRIRAVVLRRQCLRHFIFIKNTTSAAHNVTVTLFRALELRRASQSAPGPRTGTMNLRSRCRRRWVRRVPAAGTCIAHTDPQSPSRACFAELR